MNSGKKFAVVYRQLIQDLLFTGKEVEAIRGRKTKEILNYSICIENPASNLVYIEGRKFSIMHAIQESLGLVIANNSVEFASLFNERMKDFSDDGKTLYGCYGGRISGYLGNIRDKLAMDKNTRSAVLSIYKIADVAVVTKDIPCTETIQFLIRDNKLNMIVNMRSNDCIWGTPYDIFMFTNLQMVMANSLGIEVGKYYHNVGSMHLYSDMEETAYSMLDNLFVDIEKRNRNTLFEWTMLATSLSSFVRYKERNGISLSLIVDMMEDDSYGMAILKELEYREMIPKCVDDEKLRKELWLVPFTKRWKL